MRARLSSWLLSMAPDSAFIPSASAFFWAAFAADALSFLLIMTSLGLLPASVFFGGDWPTSLRRCELSVGRTPH